jgi:hypothetical protein
LASIPEGATHHLNQSSHHRLALVVDDHAADDAAAEEGNLVDLGGPAGRGHDRFEGVQRARLAVCTLDVSVVRRHDAIASAAQVGQHERSVGICRRNSRDRGDAADVDGERIELRVAQRLAGDAIDHATADRRVVC